MSMRLGTSMTFRTRPRCLRMRKFDWMTLAIAAPDDLSAPRWPLSFAAAETGRGTGNLRDAGTARSPGGASRDRELSQNFDRVKQRARRKESREPTLRQGLCTHEQ